MDFIKVYKLDEYHIIAECFNMDKSSAGWYMFTFHDTIDMTNTINLTKDKNGMLYEMEKIDIDNFEFNGRKLKLKFTE